MEYLELFFTYLPNLLAFVLGGLVIGPIVRAIDNRQINDLKTLLQGFGVLREYRKPRFWSWRYWGIRH